VQDATADAAEIDATAAAAAVDGGAPGDGGAGDTAADAMADAGTPDEGGGDASCGGDPSTAPVTITGSIANVPAGTTQILIRLTEGEVLATGGPFQMTPACGLGPATQTNVSTYPVPPSPGTFAVESDTPLTPDGSVRICGGSIELDAEALDANSDPVGYASTVVCGTWGTQVAAIGFGGPAITSTCAICNITF